jgi:tRNA(fMet)-specific endonuclease VapC
MTILDTDILSLLFAGHSRVAERFDKEEDEIVSTIVSRIEILEGRFASVMKAEDGTRLLRAQERLRSSEEDDLPIVPLLPFDAPAAAEFDRLLGNKKLKKIGRGDLLIASIALARRATLASRNVRDFRLVPGLRIENWAD